MKNALPNCISTNFRKLGNVSQQVFIFGFILCLWLPASSQVFTKIINNALTRAQETLEPSWCDYDGDGDMDVFINVYSPSVNNPLGYSYFFQNNCNGDFTQITAIPGNITKDKGSWQSDNSRIDYDNDGFPDLFTSHNGPSLPGLYPSFSTRGL